MFKIQGSVDAQTAQRFEKEALAAIARGGKHILIDGAKLDFISSAGIGVFMVILSEVEGTGFLKVMNLSEEIFESFDLLGIPQLIEFFRDEKAAQAALKKGVEP